MATQDESTGAWLWYAQIEASQATHLCSLPSAPDSCQSDHIILGSRGDAPAGGAGGGQPDAAARAGHSRHLAHAVLSNDKLRFAHASVRGPARRRSPHCRLRLIAPIRPHQFGVQGQCPGRGCRGREARCRRPRRATATIRHTVRHRIAPCAVAHASGRGPSRSPLGGVARPQTPCK